MLKTTAGQAVVNFGLPEDLRDHGRVLDKKALEKLLQTAADKHPDKYREIVQHLSKVGYTTAQMTGGNSFGPDHLSLTVAGRKAQVDLDRQVRQIYSDKTLDDDAREKKVVDLLIAAGDPLTKAVLHETLSEHNPLGMQVLSGARGNPTNLRSLRAGDLLYVDHRDRPIPVPILRSYSQGLSPVEYYAGTFGARKGVIDTKLAVQRSGFACLVADTLVRMADGTTRRIVDLVPGDAVLGADVSGRTFPVRVSNVFDNGVRRVWRYVFRDGKSRRGFVSLEATEDHVVLAKVKRGRAGTAHGDKNSILVPTKLPLRRASTGFRVVPPQGSAIDSGVREPRAWLLGLLLGDGSFRGNGPTFSNADPELLAAVAGELENDGFQLTKIRGHEYEYYIGDRLTPVRGYRLGSVRHRLVSWLAALGLWGKKSPDKYIPAVVSAWDLESQARLIAGLYDTDGWVTRSNNSTVPVIGLTMTSEPLVEYVRQLLRFRFGVSGCPVRRVRRKNPGECDQFTFVINDRMSVLRFIESVRLTGVRGAALRTLVSGTAARVRNDEHLFNFVGREVLGDRPTFDIEVDHPDHLFVLANGLIVSNSKQFNQAAHRLVVVGLDRDGDGEPDGPPRGLPVPTDDPDNEGALLASGFGPYKKNTILTPKILSHLRELGFERLVVRSPMVGGHPSGGVYARDVGVREKGGLPPTGDFVGIAAAQALCLAKGTRVRMADGSAKAIETIEPGDRVLGCGVNGVVKPVTVLNRYENGVKPVYETTFRRGTGPSADVNLLRLRSTLDHKLLSVSVPNKAADRRPAATITPVRRPAEAHTRFYAKLPGGFDDAGLRDEPFALTLGLLLGDGSYTGGATSNGVLFSCHDDSLAAVMSAEVSKFGCRLVPQSAAGEYRVSDAAGGKIVGGGARTGIRNRVRRRLVELGLWGQRSHTKTLPDVSGWTNASVAAVLAGLYATDGCVYVGRGSRVVVVFGSSSLKLVETVRDLLAVRFGIYASAPAASVKKKADGGTYRPVYSVAVNGPDNVKRFAAAINIPGRKGPTLTGALAAWSAGKTSAEAGRCGLVSQTFVGELETFDIEVDHPDHLFLLDCLLVVSNSEPLTQSMLSSKHSGGVAGAAKAVGGFELINNLFQVPKVFKGSAAHARKDGKVTSIREAPQGGHYVAVNGHDHYVGHGYEVKVKPGDEVEAGDVLSDGVPNPAEVVAHKGLGEGKRYFTEAFRKAYKDSGITAHRRNVELLARGLINHVEMTDEWGDYVPGDTVPYHAVEGGWEPRDGHAVVPVGHAKGMYLERPALHYTIGTVVKPSVVRDLEAFGVKNVAVHRDPPPFTPVMVRGMENLAHDPDWMTKFLGSYLKKNVLKSVHRGAVSDERGTSYVPSLARSVDFGKSGPVQGFTPTTPLQPPPKPAESIMKQLSAPDPGHKFASDKQPRVRAVLPAGDDHLLERLSNPAYPDRLGMTRYPGGGVEPGETPEAALVRELKEELGLEVSPESLEPLGSVKHPVWGHDEHYYLVPGHGLTPGVYRATAGGDKEIHLTPGRPGVGRFFGTDPTPLLGARKAADGLFGAFKLEHPKGTRRVLFDDDDEFPDYPLRDITYPVDYGSLPGHEGEDGDDLDAFVGTGHLSGSFTVRRPESFRTETKFYHRLTPAEKERVLRTYAPVLAGHEALDTPDALAEAVGRFRKK